MPVSAARMGETINGRGTDLARNTGIISLGTILPKAAAFVTLPILTACLTKEEYGVYDLVTVLVTLLLPALVLRVHDAAFRFLVDARDDRMRQQAIVSNIYALVIPVSITALVVLYCVLGEVADVITRLLICLYFLADIFSVSLRQVARGLGRPLDYSVSAIVSAAGKVVFAVVLVSGLSMGLYGAMVALAAASATSAVYLSIRLRIMRYVSLANIDPCLLKEMVSYSWPLVPNEVALWAVRVGSRFIVAAQMGLAANAVFGVANKVPQIISLGVNAFTLAWQENASMAAKDDDTGAYYSEMFKTMYALQAGVFGLVLAASPVLFPLLVRGDYGEAYGLIPILCLGVFCSSMASFFGGIYVAKKATKSIGVTSVLAAILSLTLTFVLVMPFGLFGVSVASVLGFLALALFRARDVRRLVDIRYDATHIAVVTAVLLLETALGMQQKILPQIINAVLAIGAFVAMNRPIIHALMKRVLSKARSGKEDVD